MKRLLQSAVLLLVTSFFSNNISAQCSTTSPPPGSWCWDSDAIVSLTIDGVSSGSSPACGNSSSGYTSLATPIRSLVKGTTVSWSVTFPNQWPEGFGMWIDYNGDGVLSSGEEVSNTTTTSAVGFSGTFTIPTTATAGTNVRLRARCQYFAASFGSGANDACASYTWGETEDYLVNICDPVNITMQPQNAMGCENTTTTIAVEASGAGGYQWQVDNGSGYTNVTNNSTFSGATTDSLMINSLPFSLNGAEFRCIMTNSCASSIKDTSDPANVNVIGNAKVNTQSGNVITCEEITTKFGVGAGGAVTGYQWQILTKGSTTGFVDIAAGPPYSGITTDSLTINKIPGNLNGAMLRCIVSSACQPDTSDTMRIEVQPLPKVVTDPPNVSVIHGSNALFVVEAQGLNLSYRWQAGYQGTYSFMNNNAIYSGVTNDSLKVTNVSEAQNGFTYRCIISGKGNCAADPDTSSVAILNVLPPLSINSTTIDNGIQLYPNPASGNEVTVTINNNEKDLEYRVINTVGKTVKQGALPNTANHSKTISIDGLSSGVYTFQISNKNGTKVSSIQFSKL